MNKNGSIRNPPQGPGGHTNQGSDQEIQGRSTREAELINGMLTNADVWYGVKKSEIDELEEVDKLLLRRVLGAPESTCIESLYLELGLIPISIIIKARRVKYLHYLVQLNENEMLSKVFNTQWKFPTKDDWTTQV